MAGKRVTWKWGNQTHSGTLIPSMETKSARFARTKNGKIKRLPKKTDLPVYIAEDPLRAVVRGTGIVLKNIPKYKSVLIK